MRRICDVPQPLLSEINEIGGYRSPHMTPGIGGDADTARRGEALEARRDIDAVAVNVVWRHDDVAEIDADAQIDAAVLRQPGVPREVSRCTSKAQRTASTTLPKSTRAPSPVCLTMRPRCSRTFGAMTSRR